MENCQTILIKETNDFCQFIIDNCNDEKSKEYIKEKLKVINYGNIILFASLLKNNNIDDSVNYVLKTYSVTDNEDNKKKLAEYINYFIEAAKIINENN